MLSCAERNGRVQCGLPPLRAASTLGSASIDAVQESDAGRRVAVGQFLTDIKTLAATRHLRGRN